MKAKTFFTIAVILVFVSIFSPSAWCKEDKKSKEPVNIDLFVMSQCPYGIQAENVFFMLSQRLKDKMRFNLYFIANEDIKGDILSLHGASEVEEDMRQLVIFRFFPDKFWQYLASRNTDYANPEWKAHAYMAGIDVGQLQNLMNTKGKDLLRENIKKANGLGVNVSPMIYINGEKYEGSRSFPSLFLKLAKNLDDKKILAGFPRCFSDANCIDANSIGICRNPVTPNARCEPLEISLKIVDIKDKAYVHDQAYVALKHYLPSLKESFVDYQSEEGKRLIGKTSAQTLPIYLISSSVEKIKDLSWLGQNRIKQDGQEYFLINNSRDFVRLYLKREKKLKAMDLFVMSKCPFGIEAEQVIYPVAKKAGISLSIYYIANFSSNPNPAANQKPYMLSSLHGETEIEEDMRQLCVKKYFPQKYFGYILARNKDINNSQWEKAAIETLGRDAEAVIRKCQNEEGKTLLEKNMLFAAELRIGASPTILWENQRRFENLKELKAGVEALKDIEIKASGSCK